MRLRLLILLAATLSCSSSSPNEQAPGPNESIAIVRSCADPVPVPEGAVNLAIDVLYSTPDGQAQHLDIAWPRTTGPHPLVVFLHGGSWSSGSKVAHRADILDLANRGYVAASVNYRLTQAPNNLFPAAIRDVRCSIRWLRANADTYAINANAIAVAGFSAGGHLASLAGMASTSSAIDSECDAAVALASVTAVISYAGPQDLRVSGPYTEAQAEIVTNFLGSFPGEIPGVAGLASPVTHADGSDPAMLLIHGTADGLVPIAQSRNMRTAMQSAGAKATLIELGGLAHSYVGLTTSQREDVRCTTVAFLERWLLN